MSEFKMIPSTGGKYSMNRAGQIKNVETGRILKTEKYKWIALRIGEKSRMCKIAQLLEETHGIPAPPFNPGFCKPVRVAIRKGNELHSFRTIALTAKFLAEREHYVQKYVKQHLCERIKFIFGWKITYYENL